MKKKYRLVAVEEEVRPCSGGTLAEADPEGERRPGVCAGGNRAAVGPRGTGPGRGVLNRMDVIGPKETWDMSGTTYLDPEQLNWLSFENMCSILDYFAFDLSDVLEAYNKSCSAHRFDLDTLRTFLADDYMRCVELVAELSYRLNKL